MSTSKRKKELRQKELRRKSEIAKYQRELQSTSPSSHKEFRDYVPTETYRREQPYYPSLKTQECNTAAPGQKTYTGDLLVGIGTMHKSNMVPVMRGTSQAEDIAKMRRN